MKLDIREKKVLDVYPASAVLIIPSSRGMKYHGNIKKEIAGTWSRSSSTAGKRNYGEHIWIYPGQQP